MRLPEFGLSREAIFQRLQELKGLDKPWTDGRVLGYIYDPGQEARAITQDAYMMFLTESGLDPTTFPSVMQLERDVVRMTINLLRGDAEVVGSFTSGGTESIMLAVKAARDKFRVERNIAEPEIILPRTAHAAFYKACAYLNLTPVTVDFDPATYRADPAAMRAAITPNTIMLVGSAPSYAQGVVDPIPEIAKIALEHGLLCHVDACVGGVQLSLMREMGYALPDFDWSVPGVTSISTDLHKFGYAAKQASVIMFRDKALRRYEFFACRRTTTYALINSTILSSKSGGPMAGAWALLHHLGSDGYKKIVRATMDAGKRMVDGIREIDGLRMLGAPDMNLFSFTAEGFNIFHLADALTRRGWYLQAQFRTTQSPANLHVTLNASSVPRVDEFLAALRDAMDEVRGLENPIDPEMVRAQIGMLLQSGSGDDLSGQLSAVAGIQGSALPQDMALINTVLDALPDEAAEALLIDFVNDLFV